MEGLRGEGEGSGDGGGKGGDGGGGEGGEGGVGGGGKDGGSGSAGGLGGLQLVGLSTQLSGHEASSSAMSSSVAPSQPEPHAFPELAHTLHEKPVNVSLYAGSSVQRGGGGARGGGVCGGGGDDGGEGCGEHPRPASDRRASRLRDARASLLSRYSRMRLSSGASGEMPLTLRWTRNDTCPSPPRRNPSTGWS
jgi:23S rRNA pseudouridine2605 synthase